MRIAVLGDCTLDVVVRPPDEPMRMGADARAQIQIGPGGQGANVAVRLARAGASVRLVSAMADDAAGEVLRAHLSREGVEVAALRAPRTAAVVVLVAPGAERTMLSDRVPLAGDLEQALAAAEWVHVSGYALRETEEAERVVDGIRRAAVPHVSVGGGSYEGGTEARVARDAIYALGAALLIVNRDEAGLLAGAPQRTAVDAAAALATGQCLAVVTDGARGAAADGLDLPAPIIAEAPAARAVDSTGAGDALTAELLTRLVGSPEASWPPTPNEIAAALNAAVAAGGRAAEAMGAQTS